MHRLETIRGAPASRRTWLAAAAAAVALAGTPAGAAPKAAPQRPAEKTPAATPAPAPRPTPAKAIPLPPPPVPAQAQDAGPRPRIAWLGGSVGALSAFDLGRSVALHVDYGILRTPSTWQRLDLEWHLVASFAMPAGETPLTATVVPPGGPLPVQVAAGQEKLSAVMLEVVPTARVLWTVGKVSFFGDAGLGLAQTLESYDRSELFVGRSRHREYTTGFVLRLGGGLAAEVRPRWRLVLSPLVFDLMLGPKFSAWTPNVGVAYRL